MYCECPVLPVDSVSSDGSGCPWVDIDASPVYPAWEVDPEFGVDPNDGHGIYDITCECPVCVEPIGSSETDGYQPGDLHPSHPICLPDDCICESC